MPEGKPPAPHPGYSKNAAIEAIRRHALTNIQRDMTVSLGCALQHAAERRTETEFSDVLFTNIYFNPWIMVLIVWFFVGLVFFVAARNRNMVIMI